MFDFFQNNQHPRRQKIRNKNNLRPLVLILGFFAIASLGVLTFTLFQKWNPPVSAAPGIYKVLNYQGKLEDSSGITVADGAYSVKFTIYDAATGGNVRWTARESDACGAPFNPSAKSVTTSLGIFSTELGESGDCPLNLDFNEDSYYLGVTVGADSEMTPRKRIGAAGYAFNTDLMDGLDSSDSGGASAFVPVTDSSGNFVLTGNVTFDATTFALDSTNDNIGIGTAAPNPNRTLDLTTANNYGIYSVTSSASKDTVAVYGESSDATNNTRYGGYFTAAGGGSMGVYGLASATGNPLLVNYGGYFTAAGDSGEGVFGEASATGAVTNVGGYFTAAGDTGYGVWSVASGTGGINYGGYFVSNGPGGYAVNGWATDTSATNYGGYFKASGVGGYGVYSEAADTSASTNYGGYFTAAGEKAVTVYGNASNSTGANCGGNFIAAGDAGIGVQGTANSTAGTGATYGGNFQAYGPGGYGVYAASNDTSAVINYGGYFYGRGTGVGSVGVYGLADGAAEVYGVRGEASDATAVANYGGYFTAAGTSNAAGVYAEATGAGVTTAVYGLASDTDIGTANFGGYFEARGGHSWSFGVKGYLPNSVGGKAVIGHAAETTSTNYGGYFEADGATGVGVYGSATSSGATANYGGYFAAVGTGGAYGVYSSAGGGSGTNYGVYGIVSSAAGWGGYFTGGNGFYASRFSIADATSGIAYNTIGAPAAGHTGGGEIEDASDLFIADDLEVDGESWFDGGHTDLAEMVAYSGEGEAGDVIVIDDQNDNSAKLATKPYDKSVLGIISTKPSLIITGGIEEGKLLAVAGRVPTKVTNINGTIHRGDLLTTSSVSGHAMKATDSGPIVGKALGECSENSCLIWVFLNISWYGGM
jgi:hypothetical protein